MPSVSISAPFLKKVVAVQLAGQPLRVKCTALLLGRTGERLKTFSLTQEDSELSLEGFSAGSYTLQIIWGTEVVAQQILIP